MLGGGVWGDAMNGQIFDSIWKCNDFFMKVRCIEEQNQVKLGKN